MKDAGPASERVVTLMNQYEESARDLARRWGMDISLPLQLSAAKTLCGYADSDTRMREVIGLWESMRRRD